MKVLCRGLATAKSTYSKSLAKSQLINAPEQPNHEGANPRFFPFIMLIFVLPTFM